MRIAGVQVAYLAKKYGTPLYVYDFAQIQANAQRLKMAFSSESVRVQPFYAMKANPHPAILQVLLSMGFGVDCVSPGELEIARRVGFNKTKILYTGNYESISDLQAALAAEVLINLDDISSFERLKQIGIPSLLSFRINPGQGQGRYHQITTAGAKAKFGMLPEQAREAYRLAKAAGVARFGAHMMTGSGILEAEYFARMLTLFLEILTEISRQIEIEFEFIDMGGGFGIPYDGDHHELAIEKVGQDCLSIFAQALTDKRLGNPALFIEPGRYLVGNAGYLIARVTGIKRSKKTFVGIDAGFNTLIRHALYGAQHTIVIDGKENWTDRSPVNLCGQICENTDIFVTDYPLPETKTGDLVVFKQAGAYGAIMAMPYNHRLRPAEVAIVGGKDILITRREEMRDYWSRIIYPKISA